MGYVHRAISEVLRNRAKSAKVVLVCGARQVGKSTVITSDAISKHLGCHF